MTFKNLEMVLSLFCGVWRKRKWGVSEANYSRTVKDRAVLSAGLKYGKVFSFFMQNFAIVRLGVYS